VLRYWGDVANGLQNDEYLVKFGVASAVIVVIQVPVLLTVDFFLSREMDAFHNLA
jgi:hypothetical protein